MQNINLLQLIHGHNPYNNFNYQHYPYKPIGWNIDKNLFQYLITETKPKIILELGSWYGASAIALGNIIKELKLDTQIICVDTWLGSFEFVGLHERDEERKLLPFFGYPSAYYQFLSNICHSNLQDIVIPFPQTTKIACQWLKSKNIDVDLIYVDGNNETIDVYQDILYGWQLLTNNGIIFGDDYNNPRWLSINLGLNKFCSQYNQVPTILPKFPKHWTIKKTLDHNCKNHQEHLIFITCTHKHINRIAYLKHLIKSTISKLKNYTWIIVEDGNSIDHNVKNLLINSGVKYEYLYYGPTRKGGNAQRNFALEYIYDSNLEGIIYSLDDDNLYKIELFDELRKVKNISIFPVGGWFRPKNDPERPILDQNHKFIGWNSGWQRKYSTDMAGFAFHSKLLTKLTKPFWTYIEHGGGETEFIDRLVTGIEDIEFNLCNNCQNCYVFHNELRNMQHPDVESLPTYITSKPQFKTKYGHSDNSQNTHHIMQNILAQNYTTEQIDKALLKIEEVYEKTEGCYGGPDRIEIASIINNISTISNADILELGCWKGRVSVILNLFKGDETNVISVDNFLSADGINMLNKKCDAVKKTFNFNMQQFNIDTYKLIENNMENIDWSNICSKKIQYIYYDNIVDASTGLNTLVSILPSMSDNCIIEFHDSSWNTTTHIIETLCSYYGFNKLYKIDIWEGSVVIQRKSDVVI
jgi:SAM-dependent methyltransferase